jgi:HEAT repeat protein
MDDDIFFWLDYLHEQSPEGAASRDALREVWADQPERLLTALREARYVLRGRAADALGKYGDASAVPALIAALHDEVDSVRGHAASALGEIGDVRAMAPLLEMLRDPDIWLKWAAAEALGNLRDPAAVLPLLEEWLDARDEALLLVITEAFKRMGVVAVPTLQIAQNDPRGDVQQAATYMLAQIGER